MSTGVGPTPQDGEPAAQAEASGGEMKRCPACAESIRAEAVICRHCGYDYRTGAMRVPPGPPPPVAQQMPASQPYGMAPMGTPVQGTNGFSIASLVLGIVWIYGIGSILALVFGYKAMGEIDRSGGLQGGRGLAIAGITLGWVGIAGLILLIIVILATANSPVTPFCC